MSVADITLAAKAMNDLREGFASFYAEADLRIAERRANYDALAGDLKGVVANRLRPTFYIDAVHGNDAHPGTIAAPLKTLLGAAAQTVSGAAVRLYLARGQVHRGVAQFNNNFVRIDPYGEGAAPIVQSLADDTGYATIRTQSSDYYISGLLFRTGVGRRPPGEAGATFGRGMHGRISLLNCAIELGDLHLVEAANEDLPPQLNLHSCAVSRLAGSDGQAKLLSTGYGLFGSSGATSLPAGTTFADFLTVTRNANGLVTNILSNLAL